MTEFFQLIGLAILLVVISGLGYLAGYQEGASDAQPKGIVMAKKIDKKSRIPTDVTIADIVDLAERLGCAVSIRLIQRDAEQAHGAEKTCPGCDPNNFATCPDVSCKYYTGEK